MKGYLIKSGSQLQKARSVVRALVLGHALICYPHSFAAHPIYCSFAKAHCKSCFPATFLTTEAKDSFRVHARAPLIGSVCLN